MRNSELTMNNWLPPSGTVIFEQLVIATGLPQAVNGSLRACAVERKAA